LHGVVSKRLFLNGKLGGGLWDESVVTESKRWSWKGLPVPLVFVPDTVAIGAQFSSILWKGMIWNNRKG